ncbi:SUMF1/EgtB/PvdO family nonheme iron enzyme [Lysinibacter sp. HNR]|uniref:formylglycine-generating enzyme family protein n=1 Tax=Lysinibacter sp. HNR TaxID=3031408 RepID=UPI0024347FB2|nr:SUMF1/EgtB/PvdO family nonheme iron enzyme [Lysinibacter sp. HNR]WGD36530.1 SUMF1/EgtB/PvdO family nonheme iron enzyme [Lysinibacter sp. HNR]
MREPRSPGRNVPRPAEKRRPDWVSEESPVHSVSWLGAIVWCNVLSAASGLAPAYSIKQDAVNWEVTSPGYRLPTEAEWEWACRANTTAAHYGELEKIAWTSTDSVESAQPVAQKTPNDFGLYDMLGNVWEWCWDYVDPARYGNYRVFRGGGWLDKPWSVRASVRRGSMPEADFNDDLGFRVARGGVGVAGVAAAQGWSHLVDVERSRVSGFIPFGWTPLRLE